METLRVGGGKKERGRKIEACDDEISLRNIMSYNVI